MIKVLLTSITLVLAAALTAACTTERTQSLQIYFVDVEGGQATLVVTPARQTLLIDSGFPADGTFQSKAADPQKARDPQRILAAARDAGVSAIDYLLVTHFHADHVGGVPELSALLPVRTFIDHDTVAAGTETNVPGTLEVFQKYEAVRAKAPHLVPKPGERLPLEGLDALVVSSNGATLTAPLAEAGAPSPACAEPGRAAQEPHENPRSTGVLLQFGTFRFLDLGDLSGPPLFALACPNDLIGPVDVYLVAHHGGLDAAEPATLQAFKPRVTVVNNGATKGGGPETFVLLQRTQGLDSWQLHRSDNPGAANAPPERIANLDETTAHWIRLEALADGSFSITNGRTGATVSYGAR